MKIKVETLEEVLGEVETEERFEIILPFLKKISELEEKNEALEETKKELERFKGTELINEALRKENLNLLENLHDLETKNEDFLERIRKLEERNRELSGKIYDEKEALKEKLSKLEDTNRKLSGELLNQTEEINLLEEGIDRLKSANEDLKRLNRTIQENQK